MPLQTSEMARILVVEDDSAQAQLITHALRQAHPGWEVEVARSAAACRKHVAEDSYDVLLLDYVLPDGDGLELLRSVQGSLGKASVIMMTAFGNEEVAAEALRAGADDYVAKLGSWLEVLCATTERCLARRAAWSQEREALRDLKTVLDHLEDVVFIVALDGSLSFLAGPTRELLGYVPSEVVGKHPPASGIAPDLAAEVKDVVRRLAEPGSQTERRLVRFPSRHRGDRWLRASFSPHTDENGQLIGIVGTAQDVTEDLERQEKLDRANRELACLQAVTSVLHANLDAEDAIWAAVRELIQHELGDGAVILLLSEDDSEVELGAHAGFAEQTVKAYVSEGDLGWRGMIETCVESSQPTVFGREAIERHSVHADLLLAEGVDNAVVAPVRIDGQVTGALLVMRRDRPYDQRDAELIGVIADQIAVTAETARIHQQVSLGLAGSSRVLEVILAINARRDLDEVLQLVARAAAEVADAMGTAVLLLDETGHDFARVFAARANGEPVSTGDKPRLDGIAHATLRRREPVFVTVGDDSGLSIRDSELEMGVKAVLTLPLTHGEATLGVLGLGRDTVSPLEPWRMRTLEMLAAQAAQAIDNTCLLHRAQHSEALYRSLFEHSGVPMLAFAPGGGIRMVNAQFEELCGYSREELEGKMSIFDLIHRDDVAGIRDAHTGRLTGEQPLRPFHTLRGLRKNGEVRWLEASIHLMPGGQMATAVVVDTTEEQQLQRQVMQSEKAAAVGQLVSGVAHELNNPLTAMLGYAQLLQAQGDLKLRRQAAAIEQEARRCQSIIESLLSFARERPAELTATDINEVVDRTLQMSAYRMRVENIRVHTDLDDSLPLIEADPHQLQQVFLNIISNAHYAMRGQADGGELFVSTESTDEVVRVIIRDTGPGMSKQQADRAFDPFFTTKDVGEGTGLGLSVSQGIVHRHGGVIYLETAEGEGATFTVELAVRAPAAGREEEAAETRAAPSGVGRVLVVDDEETLLDLVRQALEMEGHRVDTAQDVERAIGLLEVNDYDVILSDLRMPGLDGEDLLNHVVASQPETAERFIIITGDTASAETRELLERPGIRSLQKPFGIEDLQRTVAELIRPEEST
jgi:two-component system NtrC family sensor kinase